jgi:hypothetical protein
MVFVQELLNWKFPIIIAAVVIYVIWQLGSSTLSNLFNAISDVFGAGAAVASAAADQLKKCTDNGFFSSGCFIGIGIVVYAVLQIAALGYGVYKTFKSGKTEITLSEKTSIESQKSEADLAKEFSDSVDVDKVSEALKEKLGREPTDTEIVETLKRGANKQLKNKADEAVKKSQNSPENVKENLEDIARLEEDAQKESEDVINDDDTNNDIDDVVDDVIPDVNVTMFGMWSKEYAESVGKSEHFRTSSRCSNDPWHTGSSICRTRSEGEYPVGPCYMKGCVEGCKRAGRCGLKKTVPHRKRSYVVGARDSCGVKCAACRGTCRDGCKSNHRTFRETRFRGIPPRWGSDGSRYNDI